eukprot:GCRY01007029.1.p1 GENE.GCRY01007029.1~~GCRY01007029.1.p1  ORF type:complete len:106 (+),score=2.57 GCRY01007029.1:230-547(+)
MGLKSGELEGQLMVFVMSGKALRFDETISPEEISSRISCNRFHDIILSKVSIRVQSLGYSVQRLYLRLKSSPKPSHLLHASLFIKPIDPKKKKKNDAGNWQISRK